MKKNKLSFDEWFFLNEISINNYLLETGASKEMDFDIEEEFNLRYEEYLNE